MNTHIDKNQEETKQQLTSQQSKKESGGTATFQLVDNRPENVAQLKLQEMVNNSPQVRQTVQLQAMADYYTSRQSHPIQRKENTSGSVIQLNQHKKGKSRVIEARQRKNANRRERAERAREQEAQDAAAWSETVSGWASWAWDKTKTIGLEVVKKVTGGVDPFEVAQALKTVYNADADINSKIYYLTIYGTYEVSNYLTRNMATIIGGDIGAMMEMEEEINGHLESLSGLWQSGEIDEGQVDEAVADRIIGALGMGD